LAFLGGTAEALAAAAKVARQNVNLLHLRCPPARAHERKKADPLCTGRPIVVKDRIESGAGAVVVFVVSNVVALVLLRILDFVPAAVAAIAVFIETSAVLAAACAIMFARAESGCGRGGNVGRFDKACGLRPHGLGEALGGAARLCLCSSGRKQSHEDE
jgi:hypothetical protein